MHSSLLSIHVLQTRDDISNCLNSLKSSGCSISVIDNKGKNILTGRESGFKEGDLPFVSFCDDDDESMLTTDLVDSLLGHNADALYTNSIVSYSTGYTHPLSFKGVTEWNLTSETRGITKPHQTIIYRRDFALNALKEAKKIIQKQDWLPNDCDFVMRLIVSYGVGWKYVPITTYKWNIHNSNDHARSHSHFQKIRRYFASGK
jgi:hypothetical protein